MLDFLPVVGLVIVTGESHHSDAISALNYGVGGVDGETVLDEEGKKAEHTALRCSCVSELSLSCTCVLFNNSNSNRPPWSTGALMS